MRREEKRRKNNFEWLRIHLVNIEDKYGDNLMIISNFQSTVYSAQHCRNVSLPERKQKQIQFSSSWIRAFHKYLIVRYGILKLLTVFIMCRYQKFFFSINYTVIDDYIRLELDAILDDVTRLIT